MIKLDVDEFVEYVSSDLSEFKARWKEQQREFPDQFPAEMGEGDWFERFLFFIEHRGQGNDVSPPRQD